jgi:hypothetical protein
MTRSRLLCTALAAILFTGALVKWNAQPVPAPASCETQRQLQASCPCDLAAIRHYRSCQPNHWRDCMLQP